MEPTATWNPDRQVWETGQADLFSGLSEPYWETFPTGGMTLSGRLYPLPPSAHPTSASASSSSRGLLLTPRASDTGTPGRRASEGFRPPLSQVVLAQVA